MGTTLAEVLRRFGDEYLRDHGACLGAAQAKAWRAIVSCRTPAVGGQMLQCDACGAQRWQWHSCRNRHCPQCQSRARDAWRQARLSELLDVPYCHLVFTLPHELNALAAAHPRWVYETLMHCAAATLTEFAANPRWLGGSAAFSLVLHTWTQDLRRHVHVHALMACGALAQGSDGLPRWVSPARAAGFLFPVQALSRVFRGKFLQALQQDQGGARLRSDPAQAEPQRSSRLAALRAHDWVVYAKTPMAGPAAVIDYLSRYTHRTAVGNERLVAIEGDRVILRVRRNADAEQSHARRCIAIEGCDFIARLLQHVLPTGFKRIRHYGLLAPAAKAQRLSAARRLLAMPQPSKQAQQQAADFMRRVAAIEIERCCHCQQGRWQVIAQCSADRSALAALGPQRVRGPP